MTEPLLTYAMKGRLELSKSGWVLLNVPNDIGNGAFQAMTEPGIEQPISESRGHYHAHISVVRPEEVESIGGPDKIKARGQMFGFNLGALREISNPGGWQEISKCWVLEVKSPELLQLRRSLGLGDPKYPFHITVAVRRKNALRKASASVIHFKEAAHHTEIKESPIDGKGLFATVNFQDGDVIVPKFMVRMPGKDGLTRWEQAEESRFTNHSDDPNCRIVRDDGYVKLMAVRDIVKGEELTGDYDRCEEVLGPNFYFTYRGRPYGGESTAAQSDHGDAHPTSAAVVGTLFDRLCSDAEAVRPGHDHAGVLPGDHVASAGGGVSDGIREDDFEDGNRVDTETAGGSDSDSCTKTAGDTGGGEGRSDHRQQVSAACGEPLDARRASAYAKYPRYTDTEFDSRNMSGASSKPGAADVQHGRNSFGDHLHPRTGAVGSAVSSAVSSSVSRNRPYDSESLGTGSRGLLVKSAVNRNDYDEKLRNLRERRGECPGCGTPFKEDEPYPDVEMCEVCERYGKPKLVKAGVALAAQIASARKSTAPPVSPAQAEAGNYRKGKFRMHGLQITLENPKGSTRSGTAPDGKKWSVKMRHDYGYINRTEGKDGDQVDVFIGPDPETEVVFVVDQCDPKTGKFDEHKCLFGFCTREDAKAAYLSNYEDDWQGLQQITPMTIPQFKRWLQSGDQSNPVHGVQLKAAEYTLPPQLREVLCGNFNLIAGKNPITRCNPGVTA